MQNINNTTNNSLQQYIYNDDRISAPEVFYRIKGISKQGVSSYSQIVSLKNSASQLVRVFPNPVKDFRINIEFLVRVNENIEITILGTRGEKLYYNQLNPGGNQTIFIRVPALLSVKTLYILNISYSGNVINEKILFE